MIRNVRSVFLTNSLLLLFSVVTSLLSAWALKPEGRGDLAIITTWMFAFSLVGTLGLPYAHRYWAAREEAWQSEIFFNTVAYSLIAGIILSCVAWFTIPLLTAGRSPEIIRFTQLFSLNIPVILLTEMLRGQLEGARLFGWVGVARLSFITTQAVGYSIFYMAGWLNLENAVLIIVAGQVLCPLIMLAGVIRKLRPRLRFSWPILLNEASYGLRSYFGIVTGYAVLRLDQMMLAIFAPTDIIGLYIVAVALAEITATLASSVADALMPQVAAAQDSKESALLLGKSLRLVLYAHSVVLVPLWILSPYILGIVYGEGFVEATTALRILLLASVAWSAALTVISGLDGFGHPGLSSIARLISAATTVTALLILLPRWGINGAAAASLLGYGTLLLASMFCFLSKGHIGWWDFVRPRREDLSYDGLKALFTFSSFRQVEGKI